MYAQVPVVFPVHPPPVSSASTGLCKQLVPDASCKTHIGARRIHRIIAIMRKRPDSACSSPQLQFCNLALMDAFLFSRLLSAQKQERHV